MAAQSYQREAGWGGREPAAQKPARPSFPHLHGNQAWLIRTRQNHLLYDGTLIALSCSLPTPTILHILILPPNPPTPKKAGRPPPTLPFKLFSFGLVVLSCFAVARVTSFRRNIKGHEKGGLDRGPKEIMKFVHIQAELKGLLAPISPRLLTWSSHDSRLRAAPSRPNARVLVSVQKAARGTPSLRPSSSFCGLGCGVGWIQALQL